MSNETKQTAVDWLEERLNISFGDEIKPLRGFFVQAKEMEKEQFIGLLKWMNKIAMETPMRLETDLDDIVEQYYNEIYGGNK